MSIKRLCLCGKPEVGKSTIKKVIFDGTNPNKLVLFPLEATIGVKYSKHEFMDSKIMLIDTPGQSLPQLLKDEEKQIHSFENTSAIIYIFDYPSWMRDSEKIIEDIKSLYEINMKHKFEAKLILFLHKIDLLFSDKKMGLKLEIIRKQINKLLNFPEELNLYFTSLHPKLIFTIHNALNDTICNFSESISKLKEAISNFICKMPQTICFMFNQNLDLIIQEKSDDFDNSMLLRLYERIHNLSHASEEFLLKKKIISIDSNILYMAIENISEFYSNFKYIMLFSETLKRDELFIFFDDLKKELKFLAKKTTE